MTSRPVVRSTTRCRVRRQPAACDDRGRLRYRCSAVVPERRRPSADRERRRHGARTVRHHLDARAGERSAFQPGGVLRRRCFRWGASAYCCCLSAGPGHRVHRRRRAGERHVRWPSRLVQHASPHDRAALCRRDRGDGGAGSDHLRPRSYRPHQHTPRRPSAPTSALPTSSPAAPASPTRRSRSGACSPTPSPA